jgi:hypothetical protein
MRRELRHAIPIVFLAWGLAHGQEPDIAEANNPLANADALQFQDLYVPSLHGVATDAGDVANTLFLRASVVRGKHFVRATLPISIVPASGPPFYRSGFGDFTIFDTFMIKSTPKMSFAIGPQLVMPTATNTLLGSGKWQLGAAAVAIHPIEGGHLLAGLFTWQTSFAGDQDRRRTHLATAQPFVALNVGQGYYLRSSAIYTMDFEQSRYLFPLGLGVGKVFRIGDTVANAFIEPQLTIYAKGDFQPAVQFFAGINFQKYHQ